MSIEPASFDVVYAIASVHHLLNLEHFFSMIHRGLTADGRLILLDIIGKQQVLFWKENVEFAASVVKKMPRRCLPGTRSLLESVEVLRPLYDHPTLYRPWRTGGNGRDSAGGDRARTATVVRG